MYVALFSEACPGLDVEGLGVEGLGVQVLGVQGLALVSIKLSLGLTNLGIKFSGRPSGTEAGLVLERRRSKMNKSEPKSEVDFITGKSC